MAKIKIIYTDVKCDCKESGASSACLSDVCCPDHSCVDKRNFRCAHAKLVRRATEFSCQRWTFADDDGFRSSILGVPIDDITFLSIDGKVFVSEED